MEDADTIKLVCFKKHYFINKDIPNYNELIFNVEIDRIEQQKLKIDKK